MGTLYPMYRTRSPGSVGDQCVQVAAGAALAPAQERQLDDEARADDDAAELLDEPPDRLDRSAGREDVVVDDDPGALRDQLRVQLERVLAVLEHVARAHRLRRQLPRSARRHEPDTGLDRDRRTDPEPSRLGPEDEIGD